MSSVSIQPTIGKPRRDYIGSAHIATICGIDGAFGSQLSVAHELRTGESKFDEDQLPDAVEIGLLLENWVIDSYAKRTGSLVLQRQPHFRYPGWDCLGATPDAMVQTKAGRLRIMDAKVVGDYYWESVPPKYEVSSLHQLGITLANCEVDPVLDLAVYHLPARRLKIYEMPFDQSLFDQRADRAIEWYRRHVIDCEMPPLDGSSDTYDILAKIDAEIGKSVNIDELKFWVDYYEKYNAISKRADEAASKAINILCNALGDAEIGLIGGKPKFTWKRRAGVKTLDRKALEADHPEIYEAYLRSGKDFRVPHVVKRKGK